MEKYTLKCKGFTSLFSLTNLLLNLKQKVYFLVAVFLLLLFLSTSTFAAVEGILAKDDDGSYHHYCYQDLIDSYINQYWGDSDGLYEDYISKKPYALLDSINGYVDFNYVLCLYASHSLECRFVTINQITELADIKKAQMPDKIFIVSSEAGKLVRQEKRFDAQGGADTDQEEPSKTLLISDPIVTIAQAQSWAKSKNSHKRFIDIAPLYWEYGEKTGIRPEALYAQAAYETGYGHFNGVVPASFNNWAGIKIGGSNGDQAEDHEKFVTPEDGVRGHFNHISAYIGLQPIGEPHDRYYSVKSMPWSGTVKYVEELSGKWGVSSDYHEVIVRMIGEME